MNTSEKNEQHKGGMQVEEILPLESLEAAGKTEAKAISQEPAVTPKAIDDGIDTDIETSIPEMEDDERRTEQSSLTATTITHETNHTDSLEQMFQAFLGDIGPTTHLLEASTLSTWIAASFWATTVVSSNRIGTVIPFELAVEQLFARGFGSQRDLSSAFPTILKNALPDDASFAIAPRLHSARTPPTKTKPAITSKGKKWRDRVSARRLKQKEQGDRNQQKQEQEQTQTKEEQPRNQQQEQTKPEVCQPFVDGHEQQAPETSSETNEEKIQNVGDNKVTAISTNCQEEISPNCEIENDAPLPPQISPTEITPSTEKKWRDRVSASRLKRKEQRQRNQQQQQSNSEVDQPSHDQQHRHQHQQPPDISFEAILRRNDEKLKDVVGNEITKIPQNWKEDETPLQSQFTTTTASEKDDEISQYSGVPDSWFETRSSCTVDEIEDEKKGENAGISPKTGTPNLYLSKDKDSELFVVHLTVANPVAPEDLSSLAAEEHLVTDRVYNEVPNGFAQLVIAPTGSVKGVSWEEHPCSSPGTTIAGQHKATQLRPEGDCADSDGNSFVTAGEVLESTKDDVHHENTARSSGSSIHSFVTAATSNIMAEPQSLARAGTVLAFFHSYWHESSNAISDATDTFKGRVCRWIKEGGKLSPLSSSLAAQDVLQSAQNEQIEEMQEQQSPVEIPPRRKTPKRSKLFSNINNNNNNEKVCIETILQSEAESSSPTIQVVVYRQEDQSPIMMKNCLQVCCWFDADWYSSFTPNTLQMNFLDKWGSSCEASLASTQASSNTGSKTSWFGGGGGTKHKTKIMQKHWYMMPKLDPELDIDDLLFEESAPSCEDHPHDDVDDRWAVSRKAILREFDRFQNGAGSVSSDRVMEMVHFPDTALPFPNQGVVVLD